MITKNDMMIGREREKAELQRSLESDMADSAKRLSKSL